ncbi:MAG: helix-turn-helix domain-containing protein [Bacteroidota bacterium]
MEIILIIGTIESAFLFLLIMGKKDKRLADWTLALIFLLYTLSIGLTGLETLNANRNFPSPFIINLSWLILFLQGPALWLYVKSLTNPDFQLKPVYLLHLIPFLYFLVFHYFDFIRLPGPEKIAMAETELFKDKFSYKFSVAAIGLLTTGYNILALILIRDYQKKLKLNFSYIEHISLNWLRILVISSIIVYLVNSSLFITDMFFPIATYRYLMLITYSFATVYIFILGYFGLQQGNVFVNNTVNPEKGTRSRLPHSPGDKAQPKEPVFLNNLLVYMERNQPYLDPEITISKLSDSLKVKPEYLSEVLNQDLGQNFFDFINKYRIEEFKIQALDQNNRHLSITGIAHNCGFNSKAAFYRAFKKFENTTPTTYMSASH